MRLETIDTIWAVLNILTGICVLIGIVCLVITAYYDAKRRAFNERFGLNRKDKKQ